MINIANYFFVFKLNLRCITRLNLQLSYNVQLYFYEII
jgi:hypothetical protein